MTLVVSGDAVRDLVRLRQFLSKRNPDAARRAMAQIDSALRTLTQVPNRGRPVGIPGIRELIVPFGRAAYIVRYSHRLDRDEIVILRVWHGREERP